MHPFYFLLYREERMDYLFTDYAGEYLWLHHEMLHDLTKVHLETFVLVYLTLCVRI